jgi:hypothetical protein
MALAFLMLESIHVIFANLCSCALFFFSLASYDQLLKLYF